MRAAYWIEKLRECADEFEKNGSLVTEGELPDECREIANILEELFKYKLMYKSLAK